MLIAQMTLEDATNQSVISSSSGLSVATVDTIGRVTAVGVGIANIKATTEEGGFTYSSYNGDGDSTDEAFL